MGRKRFSRPRPVETCSGDALQTPSATVITEGYRRPLLTPPDSLYSVDSPVDSPVLLLLYMLLVLLVLSAKGTCSGDLFQTPFATVKYQKISPIDRPPPVSCLQSRGVVVAFGRCPPGAKRSEFVVFDIPLAAPLVACLRISCSWVVSCLPRAVCFVSPGDSPVLLLSVSYETIP